MNKGKIVQIIGPVVDVEFTGDALAGLPLAYLHVFTYSRRPGTPASTRGSEIGAVASASESGTPAGSSGVPTSCAARGSTSRSSAGS